jgi:subtilisin-like proprotein convertase family protein
MIIPKRLQGNHSKLEWFFVTLLTLGLLLQPGCQSDENLGIELPNSSGLNGADDAEVSFSKNQNKFRVYCGFDPGCDFVFSLSTSQVSAGLFSLDLKAPNGYLIETTASFSDSGPTKIGWPHLHRVYNLPSGGYYTIEITTQDGVEGTIRAQWEKSGTFGCAGAFSDGAECDCYCPDEMVCEGIYGHCSDRLRNCMVYESEFSTPIPDDDSNGVDNTISVSDAFDIAYVNVTVDLDHPRKGDLIIALTHEETEVTLWNKWGGWGGWADGYENVNKRTFQLADFEGQTSHGNWILHVVDASYENFGTLNSWSLAIQPAIAAPPVTEPFQYENRAPIIILDNVPQGIDSIIYVTKQADIATMTVDIDIEHLSPVDLAIDLIHNDITHRIWDRIVTDGDDYIKQTFQLTAFDGQPAEGIWRLHIADVENPDWGVLNSWSINITPNVE